MQTPAPVDYARATSIDEALQLLREKGEDARPHRRGPQPAADDAPAPRPARVGDRHQRPARPRLPAGRGRRARRSARSRGTRRCSPSPAWAGTRRSSHDAEALIADPVVRLHGTVGGSFCQADPAEDLSAVGSALRATLVIRSGSGTRTVPAREFHQGPYETAVGPAEILTEVRVPVRPGAGSAYEKVKRRAGDWAVAGVGAYVVLRDGTVADVGIGLTALGAEHFCAPGAEEFLVGKEPTDGEPCRGRPAGRRGLQPAARPARAGRLQAAPGRRADGPGAAPLRRAGAGEGVTCR